MTGSEWSVSSSFSSPSSPLVILRLTAMHTSLSKPRRNLSFISYLSSPRATCCVQLAAGLSCTQQQLLIVALLPISTAVHHEPAAPSLRRLLFPYIMLPWKGLSIFSSTLQLVFSFTLASDYNVCNGYCSITKAEAFKRKILVQRGSIIGIFFIWEESFECLFLYST